MKEIMHTEAQELLRDVILPFYDIERDMLVPTRPAGQRRRENDAEHSWSLAVLACTLAPHIDPDLDIGTVCQFAIVHDIPEVFAGDTSVWAEQSQLDAKAEKEAEAVVRIQESYAHFPWLVNILTAYEKQDTNEALFVRALDKYIAHSIRFMDEGESHKAMGITREAFDVATALPRQKAHLHSGVAMYYERIHAEWAQHPEYFYQG